MADDPAEHGSADVDPEAGDSESGADEGRAAPARAARKVARRLIEGAEAVVESAGAVVDSVLPAGEDGTAASRRPRRRSLRPLPNLYDVHPEARLAPIRELGLIPIPVDEIVGTAVEGPAQRGLDFKPLPPFRSRNWRGRWQRIRSAVDRLAVLPPIDVVKTAEGYWVTDGHNRVAAAKANGQLDIDAAVTAVHLPGQPVPILSGSLAAVLEGSEAIQAAGRGLLTPGASLGPVAHDHELLHASARRPSAEPASSSGPPGGHGDGTE
jgi:hypothetical protein